MGVAEAINDLLSFSTDIRAVAVVDGAGEVLAAAPSAQVPGLAAAAAGMWGAAESCAAGVSGSALEYAVVQDPAWSVAMVRQGERCIVALAGPRPAVGLLLFDLRTCLNDAYPQEAAR